MAVGFLLVPGDEIQKGSTGIAIELITYLGDETWNVR